MTPGNHPVPPIALFWTQEHDISADGLDTQHIFWITEFNRLHDADGPRRVAAARRSKK